MNSSLHFTANKIDEFIKITATRFLHGKQTNLFLLHPIFNSFFFIFRWFRVWILSSSESTPVIISREKFSSFAWGESDHGSTYCETLAHANAYIRNLFCMIPLRHRSDNRKILLFILLEIRKYQIHTSESERHSQKLADISWVNVGRELKGIKRRQAANGVYIVSFRAMNGKCSSRNTTRTHVLHSQRSPCKARKMRNELCFYPVSHSPNYFNPLWLRQVG